MLIDVQHLEQSALDTRSFGTVASVGAIGHPVAAALPSASVRRSVTVPVRLEDGTEVDALLHTFDGLIDGREHIALALGPDGQHGGQHGAQARRPLVRLHSECLTGDVLGSLRCDCGPQLREALALLHHEGGVLLYLRQEGRGIGLYPKIDAYALQDDGLDTFAANRALGFADDERDYAVAAQMLVALGVDDIELLTSNPLKSEALSAHGITVAGRSTGTFVTGMNARYLEAKARAARMHLMDL